MRIKLVRIHIKSLQQSMLSPGKLRAQGRFPLFSPKLPKCSTYIANTIVSAKPSFILMETDPTCDSGHLYSCRGVTLLKDVLGSLAIRHHFQKSKIREIQRSLFNTERSTFLKLPLFLPSLLYTEYKKQ